MQKMQTTHYIYLHDGGGNLGKYLSKAWNMIPSWGQPVKCKYCLEYLFFPLLQIVFVRLSFDEFSVF